MNLARRMTLSGIDQLWVADITYIRLKAEFVYLALILDGFSRKVVGWKLDRTLASRLGDRSTGNGYRDAKAAAGTGAPLRSRHSVCFGESTLRSLKKHGMVPSMSRPANPYDNASCESFIKTLKREEIYANDYENLEHLRGNVEEFIERYYNHKRLHSALGYRSPEEFEEQTRRESAATTLGATVRFFPESRRGIFDRDNWGRDSIAVPSPDPNPARRINEMSL